MRTWTGVLAVVAGLMVPVLTPAVAEAQCAFALGPDVPLGTGTGVRVAVDPTVELPVALLGDDAGGLFYRRFLGPEWGVPVTVDTQGQTPFLTDFDLVLDDLGRPRVVFVSGDGVYHTRLRNGWSALEEIRGFSPSLPPEDWGAFTVRLERDVHGRVHLILWSEVSGRRGYHYLDEGSGFALTEEVCNGGRSLRGATDQAGNLHFTCVRNAAEQYQVYYQVWSPDSGWSVQEQITHEPQPPGGTGPLGFSPEIGIDSLGAPHVIYPMHATDDSHADGETHYITLGATGWTAPVFVLDSWGHGAHPCFAVDHRDTMLTVGMINQKIYAADFADGSGFGASAGWSTVGGLWHYHDLDQTRGRFWHPFKAAYSGDVGDIWIQAFSKSGSCPGVSATDPDDDGVDDSSDLCPGFPDPAQRDTDGDGVGDACDEDDDDDGVDDAADVCPTVPDPGQVDSDGDGLGDACENLVDGDGDGVLAPWDCDDADPDAYPGSPEVCDGRDNDCDGQGDPASCGGFDGGVAPDGGPSGDGGGGGADAGQPGSAAGGCSCRTSTGPVGLPVLLLLLWLLLAKRRITPTIIVGGLALLPSLGIAGCSREPSPSDKPQAPMAAVVDGKAPGGKAAGRGAGARTPLTLLRAATLGKVDAIGRLLAVPGAAVDQRSKFGATPLMLAALFGHLEACKLLLAKGADVNARNQERATPLHYAVQSKKAAVVGLLLAQGALVDAQDKRGWTPLHKAGYVGNVDVARALLDAKAKLELKQQHGSTPLHTALAYGKPKVARLLVLAGASLKAVTIHGTTPLHSAAQGRDVDLVTLMVKRGADPNAKAREGKRPLHGAARFGAANVIRRLVQLGADVNAPDDGGWTPLHVAAFYRVEHLAAELLKLGAKVNAKDKDGQTPLHEAMVMGTTVRMHMWGNRKLGIRPGIRYRRIKPTLATLLIDKGADINAPDKHGNTPLHASVIYSADRLAALLLKRGARRDLKNKQGLTPLALARKKKRPVMIKALEKKGP